MLRIDRQVFPGSGLGEPCELHDRAASRVENEPLNIPGILSTR
jgi:hypothetical protein